MVKIICEGKSDKEFLSDLLKMVGIETNENHFLVLRGKDNLAIRDNQKIEDENLKKLFCEIDNLKALVNDGLVKKILIIIDANDDYEKSYKLAYEFLETHGLIEIGKIFIVCNEDKKGYLESLILDSLDTKTRECIKAFKNCMDKKIGDKQLYYQIYKPFFEEKLDMSASLLKNLIEFLKQNIEAKA